MILTAHDADGAPLAGLTPTWAVCLVASTGAPASQPAISPVGGGLYALALPADRAGILDFGATASPRYVVVANADVTVLAAFGLDGAPLPSLTPTWASWRVAATGADATPGPAITELSGGLYRVESPPDGEVGVIDLGATASPRYVTVGDPIATGGGGDDPTPPVVTAETPQGTVLTPATPVVFTVTDEIELRRVIVHVRHAGRLAVEVVHDGDDFAPLYAGSSRTAITGGWRYSVTRLGGWLSAPTFRVFAADAAGNEPS